MQDLKSAEMSGRTNRRSSIFSVRRPLWPHLMADSESRPLDPSSKDGATVPGQGLAGKLAHRARVEEQARV